MVSLGLPSPQHGKAEQAVDGRRTEGSERRLQHVPCRSIANTFKIIFPMLPQSVHHVLHEALAVPVQVVLRGYKKEPALGSFDRNQAALVLLRLRAGGAVFDHSRTWLSGNHFTEVKIYWWENVTVLVVERNGHVCAAAIDPDSGFNARDERGERKCNISSFWSRHDADSLTGHLEKKRVGPS